MFNKVIMVGNLTRDLELRYAPSGTAIGNTGIATSRKFKSGTGESREEVCFVDITFFGRTAEIANQYLRKGSKVLVEGRLKYDTWDDQNGNRRSKHSITVESMQMLGSKNDSDGGAGYNNQSSSNNYQSQNQNQGYNQPQNNSYEKPVQQQSSGYNQPPTQQEHKKPDDIPSIDVDDSEIPF